MSTPQHFSPTNLGNIGNPPVSQVEASTPVQNGQADGKKQQIKDAYLKFTTWILGFVVSLMPLTIIPFLELFKGSEFSKAFNDFFANNELFFIGVSIAISAINDFVNNTYSIFQSFWFQANLVLIVFGSFIYTLLTVQQYYEPSVSNTPFTIFIGVYLSVSLILGCIRYINNIREQKKGSE